MRHRHAWAVPAGVGIGEMLNVHPSTTRVHLDVPVRFPDGWEAATRCSATWPHTAS